MVLSHVVFQTRFIRFIYIFAVLQNYEPIDTLRPMDIVAEEELERVSAMLQRDNLVRGLGIVDAVYRFASSFY